MSPEEHEALINESMALKMLLVFHGDRRNSQFSSQKDYEEYIDAILDRLNEIKRLIEKYPPS